MSVLVVLVDIPEKVVCGAAKGSPTQNELKCVFLEMIGYFWLLGNYNIIDIEVLYVEVSGKNPECSPEPISPSVFMGGVFVENEQEGLPRKVMLTSQYFLYRIDLKSRPHGACLSLDSPRNCLRGACQSCQLPHSCGNSLHYPSLCFADQSRFSVVQKHTQSVYASGVHPHQNFTLGSTRDARRCSGRVANRCTDESAPGQGMLRGMEVKDDSQERARKDLTLPRGN
mmetsp:Transcript_31814/g.80096  ORF Transcript_31814/g.80096 Transcript_31814/m.80096 type:complete len:227 (-) Transcript_31814:275-955(-)